MKVDYISDLHLDFHVRVNSNQKKYEENTYNFLQGLLPSNKGEILIIAGDISHYNRQSYMALKYFSEQYDHVFFVTGNHDYYLISGEQEKKYKKNSMNREMELVGMIAGLMNVTMLYDFQVYEYKGVKISGSTSWYPLTEFKDRQFFNSQSNDSRLIRKMDIGNLNYIQTEKYDEMDDVDILVTHVPSIEIDSHKKYGSSSCYLNPLKSKAKHNVFGHCHEQNVYEKGDCKFYINALGYDGEYISHMNPLHYSLEEREAFKDKWMKIKSFEIN